MEGGDTRTVLIRGIGPGLSGFGVSGAMADPKLSIYRGSTLVAVGSNYIPTGSTGDLSWMNAYVGAFNATTGDQFAALTLAPGSYTAEVTSQSGGSGIALVEIYEFP